MIKYQSRKIKNLIGTRYLPIFIFLIGFFVAVVSSSLVVTEYTDSYSYLSLAQHIKEEGKYYIEIEEGLFHTYYLPAYPMLIAALSVFTGNYMVAARLISWLSSSFLLVFVYLIVEKSYQHKSAAILSTILIVLNPLYILISGRIMSESLFIAVFALSFYYSLQSDNFKNIMIMFLLVGIASLIRYDFLLLFIYATLISIYKRSRVKYILYGLISSILMLLSWQIVILYNVRAKFPILKRIIEIVLAPPSHAQRSGILNTEIILDGVYITGNAFLSYIGISLIIFMGIGFFYLLKKRSQAGISLIFWIVLVSAFYIVWPFKDIRHIYFAFPPCLIFASIGIHKIFDIIRSTHFKKLSPSLVYSNGNTYSYISRILVILFIVLILIFSTLNMVNKGIDLGRTTAIENNLFRLAGEWVYSRDSSATVAVTQKALIKTYFPSLKVYDIERAPRKESFENFLVDNNIKYLIIEDINPFLPSILPDDFTNNPKFLKDWAFTQGSHTVWIYTFDPNRTEIN